MYKMNTKGTHVTVNELKNLRDSNTIVTRKLSYRKDDRAIRRPIYGCPEKFRESWL